MHKTNGYRLKSSLRNTSRRLRHANPFCHLNDATVRGSMKRIGKLLWSVTIIMSILGFAQPGRPISEREQLLIDAVDQRDLASVKQLLKHGADVESRDTRGRTALLIAVGINSVEIARLLIEAGANVNAQDHQMDSPLLLAGAEGRLEILPFILEANPDFTLYNRFGGTALIPGCERGHLEVVKVLLKTDIDVDHVNNLGWIALLEAIVLSNGRPRHQQIIQLFVKAGADIQIADEEGISPLLHARRKGFREIVTILESADAHGP
ncbi:ankyrin repeat domain-containing protein [Nitrospira sp. M1]